MWHTVRYNWASDKVFDFEREKETYNYDSEKGEGKLEIELPGFSKDQIMIEVSGGNLLVEAKKEKKEYKKSWVLDKAFDVETVKAEMKDGLLTITFMAMKPTKHTVTVS